MVQKIEPAEDAEGRAAALVAIQDLRTAAAHLQSAAAALSARRSSVAAAYIEHALYHCQLELAAFEPAPFEIDDGPG